MPTGSQGPAAARGRAKAAPRKPKVRAWRKKFLAKLAESSNISASCAHAKISPQHVYATRRDDPEFNRAWQVALCEGYDMLEMDLLRRLREGDEELEGKPRRKYDNATAFRQLAAHKDSAARQRAVRDHEDAAAVRASIDAKLDEMRERVLAARAAAQAAERG